MVKYFVLVLLFVFQNYIILCYFSEIINHNLLIVKCQLSFILLLYNLAKLLLEFASGI